MKFQISSERTENIVVQRGILTLSELKIKICKDGGAGEDDIVSLSDKMPKMTKNLKKLFRIKQIVPLIGSEWIGIKNNALKNSRNFYKKKLSV